MLLSELLKDLKDSRYLRTKDSLPFSSWVGVDLDGTLAKYEGFKGERTIGQPVAEMVKLVKRLISSGKTVKIFTARVYEHPELVSVIKEWLKSAGLPALEVTCCKDPGMTELYDDRARRVEKNTGKVLDGDSLPTTEFQGIKIAIENPKGSKREGTDSHGEDFSTKMFYPYGYIVNTEGVDGDEIDCFIGPDKSAPFAYTIHQRVDGKYDEDKVMLGFSSREHARDAFMAHYDDQSFLGPITTMSMADFKVALKGHKPGTRIG